MKALLLFLILISIILPQTNEHFFVTTGKKSTIGRGDKTHRQIFIINVPKSYSGKLFFRVFDADVGGNYDEVTSASAMNYYVYPYFDNYQTKLNVDDKISETAFISETVGNDPRFDNQWRSLAVLNTDQGREFIFIVDGADGKATNLYRFTVSSHEFFNTDIPNLSIEAPLICIRPVYGTKLSTQIYFTLPEKNNVINAQLFDAESASNIYFETNYRRFTPIKASANKKSQTTKIKINPEEQGKRAAILVTKNRVKKENFQIRIEDENKKLVHIQLPLKDLIVNNLAKLDLKLTPLSDCYSVTLDASRSRDSDGDPLRIDWLFPDGSRQSGLSILHKFQGFGKFPVQIAIHDASGQVAHTSRFTRTVWINQPPTAEISFPQVVVPNESVLFDASKSVDLDGKILSYDWIINDSIKKSGKKVRHQFKYPGRYSILLKVKDNGLSSCKSDEIRQMIWVNAKAIPAFSLPKIAAVNEAITLDASKSTDSDGDILAYEWSISDGTKLNGKKSSHRFKKAGLYTISLKLKDNANVKNSSVLLSKKLRVNAEPFSRFQTKKLISSLDNSSFSAQKSSDSDGKIIRYEWNFGDGMRASGRRIKHQFADPGLYTVSLTVTDNSNALNQSNTSQQEIRVNFPPIANAGSDRIIRSNVAEFDGSLSSDQDDKIISYDWDFGDGKKASGKKVQHVYKLAGTYTASLSVRDASKTKSSRHSTQVKVRVNAKPLPDAGDDISAARNEQINFDASSSADPDGKILSYEWDFGDGNSKFTEKTSHQYSKSGRYHVRLKVKDNDGSVAYDYLTVTVNEKPQIVLKPLKRIATNEKLSLDASSSFDADGKISAVTWTLGESKKRGYKQLVQFAKSGLYPFTLEVQDDSGQENNSSIYQGQIHVNHKPVADAGEAIYTDQLIVELSAENSYDKDNSDLLYEWDLGDGTKQSGKTIRHRYQTAGHYPVKLRVDDQEGLSNSLSTSSTVVHINSTPIAKIEAKSFVCASENVLFSAAKSRDADKDLLKYEWDFGDGKKADGLTPVHKYSSSGYFNVRLKVSDNSGQKNASSTSTHLVYVSAAPVARAGEDQIVCANTLVYFDASKSIGGKQEIKSYSWDFGDYKSGGGVKTSHIFTKEGKYKVRLTVEVADNGDCISKSSDELLVTVLPSPQASFSLQSEAALNESITLDASSSSAGSLEISDYIWNLGDGTEKKGKKLTHQYTKAGRYTIRLQVRTNTEQGCNKAEISRTIIINQAPTAEFTYRNLNGKELLENDAIFFTAEKSSDPDGFIKSYQWSIDGKVLSKNVEFQHRFAKAKNYNVKLDITDNRKTSNNHATIEKTIQVLAAKQALIKAEDFACVNTALDFELNHPLDGYWTLSGEKIAASENKTKVSYLFKKAGAYQIQFRTKSTTISKDIRIFELPKIELFTERDAYEINEAFELLALSATGLSDYNLNWEIDGKKESGRTKKLVTFTKAGDKKIRLEIRHKNYSCLKKTIEKVIHIYEKPQLAIWINESTLYSGGIYDAVEFRADLISNLEHLSYKWSFGDGTSEYGKNLSHSYKKAGVYRVKLTVWNSRDRNAKYYSISKKIRIKAR